MMASTALWGRSVFSADLSSAPRWGNCGQVFLILYRGRSAKPLTPEKFDREDAPLLLRLMRENNSPRI